MLMLLGLLPGAAANWISAIALPLLMKVPRWFWVALGVLVGGLYYGHWTSTRATARCELKYATAAQAELTRQHNVAVDAIHAATQRAVVAEEQSGQLAKDLDDAVAKAQKLADANRVCLPSTITDGLRRTKDRGR